jgi:hypothetical protein
VRVPNATARPPARPPTRPPAAPGPAAQQATLLELLEAPQLMDTCVRNGIYDEALDLAAFIGRLGLLHPDLPVVRLLQRQAAEVSAAMLEQLLQRLRGGIQVRRAGGKGPEGGAEGRHAVRAARSAAGLRLYGPRRLRPVAHTLVKLTAVARAAASAQPIQGRAHTRCHLPRRMPTKPWPEPAAPPHPVPTAPPQLPECLRVIGYLRRMAAFSEGDLRLQFLRCREQW